MQKIFKRRSENDTKICYNVFAFNVSLTLSFVDVVVKELLTNSHNMYSYPSLEFFILL